MGSWKLLDGNHAAAWGARLSNAQVVGIYPITPQTEVVSQISQFVADGEMKAELVVAECEHSALSICIGASAMGSRAFTASCSQGIVHMEEPIWFVPGYRLPIVMGVVNRPIAFPAGEIPDNNDSLLQRDAGWLQFYCDSSQEVLDMIIQAYKIAENKDVYLPALVCWEGRVISFQSTPVEIPDQEDVDDFLPPYRHEFVSLDPKRYKVEIQSRSVPGSQVGMEQIYQLYEAMDNAKAVIKEVNEEYGKRFGRRYGNGLIEKYQCDDAEAVLITMGSITGTAKHTINDMRQEGFPIGLINLRTFRPFPKEDLREAVKNIKAIGFVDRSRIPGSPGPGIGCIETASALYSLKEKPLLISFYAGLGGRDVTPTDVEYMANKVLKAAETGRVEKEVEWFQLRA